jgi:hypothetical protein
MTPGIGGALLKGEFRGKQLCMPRNRAAPASMDSNLVNVLRLPETGVRRATLRGRAGKIGGRMSEDPPVMRPEGWRTAAGG